MPEVEITLRPAEPEDVRLLFVWRNDELTRQMSFHTEAISWEDHIDWYEQSLSNVLRQIYIGEVAGQPGSVGQVRFDIQNDTESEISLVIAPEQRGKGLGKYLITGGIKAFRNAHPSLEKIIALIKPTNTASKRVFEKSGFRYLETFAVEDGVESEKWIYTIS